MTCAKQEFCIHEKYCQRHIGQNFDGCILFSRHLFSRNNEPMTNEEWLHTLNTEQLAEWIVRIVDCECCPVKKPCKKQSCKKQIEMWLKKPHTIKG